MSVPRRLTGVAVLAVLVAGGCGSRLDRATLEAANGLLPGALPAGPTPIAAAGASGDPASAAPGDGAGPLDAPRAGSAAGSPSAGAVALGSAGPPAAAGKVPAGTAPGAPIRSVERPGAGPAPGSGAGPSVPSPPAGPAGTAARGAEIVFGSFGAQTGILGAVTRSAAAGVRAWAASANSRGGLNGHPIRLVFANDGGDPARTQAVVRHMVEQEGAVAFLNHFSFTLSAVLPYLERKGVPVIGGTNADENEDKSSIVFQPLLGADDGIAWSFLLNVAAQTTRKRIAIVYCREVTQCDHQRQAIEAKLPYGGLEIVYEAQVSLAQPDYTAEMIGAQQAKAEVIVGLIDTASLVRVARSARRQGYDPLFSGPHNLESDQTLAGGEETEGFLVPSRLPPYSTSPLMADYRNAMARYQPGEDLGGAGSGGFVAGRLLESLAPSIGEPLTSQGLTAALYGLRGETLG
ncbi:MAG TPA: ABC transporter substrate-binding protein, partial [Acidimicrobiia bacterium]|nr:ABC transporter substrate-binding protein [Acidimicrobiia bacterium]